MRTSEEVNWELKPFSWEAAERLARELALPFPVASILCGRGLHETETARKFLDCSAPVPDPFLFADMEPAVSLLMEAARDKRRVTVHGDYDADGITATALMVHGLRDFGIEAQTYLPSRFTEGFGLSSVAVESIGVDGDGLLVTVDCGVNYPEEVRTAKELGLDVIVVDHHRPGPELPDCPLIHPVRGVYPHDDLCGVGLAFKLLHGLHIRTLAAAAHDIPETLAALLDLVAVGTIADLAPLRGENRLYVREGLKLMTIGSRVGLRALSQVSGCSGAVDSGAVSYRIAPRLNAAGRLADAQRPLDLLLTDDESEARSIAAELHELNSARQDVERQITEEAVAQVEALDELPALLVLSGAEWHEGVVGIVASRLVERYHRPAILLGERDQVAKGSGRSIAGYDLMSGLNASASWLTVYGGHTQAAGLTLPSQAVEGFREAIQAHAAQMLSDDDLRAVYRADTVLTGEELNADTAAALASLGPFGSGNPRPRLVLVGADLQQLDVTRTGAHLRCMVEVDGVRVRAIGFGMGDLVSKLRDDPAQKVLGVQLRVDEWQGALRPELWLDRIAEVRPCSLEAYGGAHAVTMKGGDGERSDRPAPQTSESGLGSNATTGRSSVGNPVDERVRPLSSGLKSLSLPYRPGRDLRGGRVRLSALAQVLAGGEPTVILTCSVTQALEELNVKLPLGDLTRRRLRFMGRASAWQEEHGLDWEGVIAAEWDVAVAAMLPSRVRHAVVIDPPYRREHVDLLRGLTAAGVFVHLCYGDEQRHATAKLLRYLVHPRFAMVCVYRALEAGTAAHEVHRMASELAWQEGRVVLDESALSRAIQVLDGLDLEHGAQGEAKISLETIPLYAEAEADYEECSRLCQTL